MARRNYVLNPRVESVPGQIGGAVNDYGDWGTPTSKTRRTNQSPPIGVASLEVVTDADGEGCFPYTYDTAGWTPAVSGEVFQGSALMKGSVGRNLTYTILYATAAFGFLSSPATATAADGTWQTVSVGGAAPATTAWALPLLTLGGGGGTFHITAVLLEKAASSGGFFDGSVPGCWWAHNAHNSVSVKDYRMRIS